MYIFFLWRITFLLNLGHTPITEKYRWGMAKWLRSSENWKANIACFKKVKFLTSLILISYGEKIKASTIIMAFNVCNNQYPDKDKFSSLT